MATKVQVIATGAPVVGVVGVGNLGLPLLTTTTATSRVASANFEAAALKKGSVERIQKALMAGSIAVRRSSEGGRYKPNLADIATVLGALAA